MASTQLQLHAMPEDVPDICQLIRSATEGVRIYTWGQPYKLEEIGPSSVVPHTAVQLVASVGEIEATGGAALELFDRYPGLLVMTMPLLKEGQLKEIQISALATAPEGDSQVAIWAKMLKKLKKQLVSGADVVNPRTGASQFYRSAHATNRAIEAAKSGVRLIASGGNIFRYRSAISGRG
jgi:hypothetical protein